METKHRPQQWQRDSSPPEDWRNLILEAAHEDEVLELVRDHMALWAPHEIARLPEDCRPGRIRDAEDISRWAFNLATNHCAQNISSQDEPFLERMLEFVTQAAIRLSELQASPHEGHAD